MFEALWNESFLRYFCTPTRSYQSKYCGVSFDLPGAGNIQLECFMWKKCVPGGVGVLTEGYTHQILFIISLPLVMCPRTLQSLVSIFLCGRESSYNQRRISRWTPFLLQEVRDPTDIYVPWKEEVKTKRRLWNGNHKDEEKSLMLCSLVMTSPLEQATHRPSTARCW